MVDKALDLPLLISHPGRESFAITFGRMYLPNPSTTDRQLHKVNFQAE